MIQNTYPILRKAVQVGTAFGVINTGSRSRQFATSKEVPPKVMSNTANAQKSDRASATSSAQGVEKTSFKSITRTQLTPGDLVFKVGAERSHYTDQKIMAVQKEIIIPHYTSNQHLLPVETHRVTHCDISVGDGLLARVGGPRNKKELALMGKQSPNNYTPTARLQTDSDCFVVLRPKNEQVAESISETAKDVIDQGSNYSVPKVVGYYMNPHDRGEQETPSMKGSTQGPQPKPQEIPTDLQCAEYVSNVVISSEKKTLRADRTAIEAESIDRTNISPAELIDTLAGSGNFEILRLDPEEKERKDPETNA